ncbi:hypothetical protein [Desulfatitalea tepidiphila]|uniref:hypothetical protein n=1 Tax=Desulfatitalea tepidiphila TaxID=1185843 RepID=UPI0006B64A7E|nr:hypothetical protein [Desulfatitalea tepidiphila]
MVEEKKSGTSNSETRKRVFISRAQVLSEEQRGTLTDKEKAFEASCKDRGVWLELFCPDDRCFTEEERIEIPIYCEDPRVSQKLWLNLFCPDGECEITSPSQLP